MMMRAGLERDPKLLPMLLLLLCAAPEDLAAPRAIPAPAATVKPDPPGLDARFSLSPCDLCLRTASPAETRHGRSDAKHDREQPAECQALHAH